MGRTPRFETLEDRRLLVAGAFEIPTEIGDSDGFSGVVQLRIDNDGDGASESSCSGSLLETGQHILTAAHCFDDNSALVDVRFDIPGADEEFFDITGFYIHPLWNGDTDEGNDLAVLNLEQVANFSSERYELFRGTNEIADHLQFTVAGYGSTGTGSTGRNVFGVDSDGDSLSRREIQRITIDATGGTFTISIDGDTTNAITFDPADLDQVASDIEAALNTDIDSIDVVTPPANDGVQVTSVGTGPNAGSFEVLFGDVVTPNMDELLINDTNLVGGSAHCLR